MTSVCNGIGKGVGVGVDDGEAVSIVGDGVGVGVGVGVGNSVGVDDGVSVAATPLTAWAIRGSNPVMGVYKSVSTRRCPQVNRYASPVASKS